MATSTFRFSLALSDRVAALRAASNDPIVLRWYGYRVEVKSGFMAESYRVFRAGTDRLVASFDDSGMMLERVWAADGWKVASHHLASIEAAAGHKLAA